MASFDLRRGFVDQLYDLFFDVGEKDRCRCEGGVECDVVMPEAWSPNTWQYYGEANNPPFTKANHGVKSDIVALRQLLAAGEMQMWSTAYQR